MFGVEQVGVVIRDATVKRCIPIAEFPYLPVGSVHQVAAKTFSAFVAFDAHPSDIESRLCFGWSAVLPRRPRFTVPDRTIITEDCYR